MSEVVQEDTTGGDEVLLVARESHESSCLGAGRKEEVKKDWGEMRLTTRKKMCALTSIVSDHPCKL
jgi:hypothetical protein